MKVDKIIWLMFLHLFVNLSIISFHSVIFVFATRLKSRDIKRAWSSKFKGCKNETDSMGSQQLNNADFYLVIWLMITRKLQKNKNKTLNLIYSPRPHHSQLYIKGTRFSKVSVPFLKWSVFHGSSIPSRRWSAGQGEKRSTLARSKEEQLNAHATNL